MDGYHKSFKGICDWKYQDEELEGFYANFVKKAQKTDDDYLDQ